MSPRRPTSEDADPSTAIGVVVLAAIARSRLAERRQVRLSWLAALASVATSRLRQLVTSGEIRTTDGHVRADDARRWLAVRDVPGYRTPK